MLADVRFALRLLLRTPLFTCVAILMLAAGMGLSMFMFSAMNTLAFQPLPFVDADRLVHVDRIDARTNGNESRLSLKEYLDLREHQHSLDSLAGFATGTMNISGADGAPERLAGAWVSPDAFATLGMAPVLGRGFGMADSLPGAPAVALIGYRLWELNFNAAEDVVGRSIRINGSTVEIIGVMPPKFAFPREQAVWMPLPLDHAWADSPNAPEVEGFGLLRDGIGIAQARQELSATLAAIARPMPAGTASLRANVKPMDEVYVPARLLRSTSAMSISVLLVLLISCANVASLVLARFSQRRRELSVRSALGASRRRLMRQVFVETGVIAMLAGVLGYAGARYGGHLMMGALASVPGHLPYWVDFEVTFVDIAFSVGIAACTALVAGWLPARRVARTDPRADLVQGGPGSVGSERRSGRMLVAFEVALCTALLASAALAIDSSIRSQRYPLGFTSEGLLTGRIGLDAQSYPTPDARLQFADALRTRLQALPGVSGATIADTLPLMSFARSDYERVGDTVAADGERPRAWTASVDGDYFKVLGVPLKEGRFFDARDTPAATPVALVSASFAATAWPAGSAIGQRLRLYPDDQASPWLEVVGVVGDNLMGTPLRGGENNVFRPLTQDPARSISFAVRADGQAASLAGAVRAQVAAIDADLPVYWMRSMEDWREQTFWPQIMMQRLFGTFALFALLLAIGGIHAVLAFDVAGRIGEIGVRRALGASAGSLLVLVLGRVGRQVMIGLIAGIPLAIGLSLLIARSLMPGTTINPVVWLAALAVLLIAVGAAALVPARRALRVDPAVALRNE